MDKIQRQKQHAKRVKSQQKQDRLAQIRANQHERQYSKGARK